MLKRSRAQLEQSVECNHFITLTGHCLLPRGPSVSSTSLSHTLASIPAPPLSWTSQLHHCFPSKQAHSGLSFADAPPMIGHGPKKSHRPTAGQLASACGPSAIGSFSLAPLCPFYKHCGTVLWHHNTYASSPVSVRLFLGP